MLGGPRVLYALLPLLASCHLLQVIVSMNFLIAHKWGLYSIMIFHVSFFVVICVVFICIPAVRSGSALARCLGTCKSKCMFLVVRWWVLMQETQGMLVRVVGWPLGPDLSHEYHCWYLHSGFGALFLRRNLSVWVTSVDFL